MLLSYIIGSRHISDTMEGKLSLMPIPFIPTPTAAPAANPLSAADAKAEDIPATAANGTIGKISSLSIIAGDT